MFNKGKKIVLAALVALSALLTPQLAAASSPGKHSKTLEKASALIDSGKYKEAEALLAGVPGKEFPEVYYYLGILSARKHDFRKTEEYLRKGAELNELNSTFKLACFYCLPEKKAENGAKGFALFKKVAESSGYPEAYFQMGRMLIIGDGVPKDQQLAVKYLKAAAQPASKEYKPHAVAAYILGTFFREEAEKTTDAAGKKKLWEEAYTYLELAAGNKICGAWLTLGNMYCKGQGIEAPDKERALLCYKAAAADPEQTSLAYYNIGTVYLHKGEPDEALKWMKLAAARGSESAQKYVREDHARFKKNQKKKSSDKKAAAPGPTTMTRITERHTERLMDMIGLSKEEKKGIVEEKKDLEYIFAPLSEELQLKEWTFDDSGLQKERDRRLCLSRKGFYCWMTDEFLKEPLEDNLLPPNPTIRHLGYMDEEAVTKYLTEKKFPAFPREKADAFYRDAGLKERLEFSHTNKIWQLRKNLYFGIFCDLTGAWKVRDYTFFITDDGGKVMALVRFNTPPGKAEARLIGGLLKHDAAAINNIAAAAVLNRLDCDMTVDGKWSGSEMTIVTLLKQSCKQNSPHAAFNLSQLCVKAGDKEKARYYLDLCKELRKKQTGK